MKTARRLLEDFKPSHYQITLHPDPEKLVFSGTVTMRLDLEQKHRSIVVHSHGLGIDQAKINDAVASTKLDEETDELTVQTTDELSPGEHTVTLEFHGKITDAMVGMYPCYFEHDGQKKRLIATQFESHHAREVFPCIDEPAAKALFDVTLVTPAGPGQVVLGNTPIKEQVENGDVITTTFETSPKMSTYLLAFAFGEMKSLEAKTRSGVIVRTWATPDNVSKTKFALDVAVQCLDFYNDYFETPYPLAKCDMVALPDFAAGAMENWGLITYRESAMLVDEKTTALPSKQWVALVVAHELAHQWFGNLVTMEWWTDLWLNEGFASWVEYVAVDRIFPEWNMWTEFVTDDFLRGQGLDSLASSHPIEVDVPDPDEIRNIFDAISYSKGASVIRMLDAYLGAEEFRVGLAHYLKKNAYGNARTADLWAALEETSGKPVKKFMNSWTTQTGFPLVSATKSADQISLTQRRYLINPKARGDESSLWPIPIDATTTNSTYTLDAQEGQWQQTDQKAPKLNTAQTGFYMVAYDEAWLKELAEQVSDKSLEPVERLGLLNDAFQLAKAGQSPTTHALSLLDAYDHEDHAAVWDIIVGQLGSIRGMIDDDDIIDSMKPFLKELTAHQVQRLGWKELAGEPHFDTLLRPMILATASFAENETVTSEALARFEKAERAEDLSANLRGTILGAVAREGKPDSYQQILDWYKSTSDAQLKSSLAGSLSSFKSPGHIDQSLALITSEHVRLQEVVHWVSFVFGNRKAKTAAWDWMTNNWHWLKKQFGTDIMTFMYFPRIAGRSFADEAFLEKYDAFFESVDTKGIQRAVEQGRESIEWQAAWKQRDFESIKRYFSDWNHNAEV